MSVYRKADLAVAETIKTYSQVLFMQANLPVQLPPGKKKRQGL
ncbi:MAG: hypothetical protein ACK56F_32390 [bacterium]